MRCQDIWGCEGVDPSLKELGSTMLFWKGRRVIVTGGAGFLGSFLRPLLEGKGAVVFVPRARNYDLVRSGNVVRMLNAVGDVDMIIHLAARCGGIGLNKKCPYTLCYENLVMGTHIIHQAVLRKVKIVCMGTICSYPKFAPLPFKEENLWDGYPEETNAPYGVAKKMLLVLLQASRREFGHDGIFLMPVNLYGPRDHFDPEFSHVIPALIRKFVKAKEQGKSRVVLWGTGTPTRDFLYVEDAARAVLLAAEKYNQPEPMNLGTGRQVTITRLADLIREIVGYEGEVVWDKSKPDGQPRRAVDASRAMDLLGWTPKISLEEGLQRTLDWYLDNTSI